MKDSDKPKHRIGDIVVSRHIPDPDDDYEMLMQRKIIDARAFLDRSDPDDTATWFYDTETEGLKDGDSLQDNDILWNLTNPLP